MRRRSAAPDPGPVVRDGERSPRRSLAAEASTRPPSRPWADGVVEQVEQGPAHRVAVPPAHGRAGSTRHSIRVAASLRARGDERHRRAQQLGGSTGPKRGTCSTRVRVSTRSTSALEPLALLGHERPVLPRLAPALRQRLAQHADRGERRAQLVGDAGQERALARDGTRLPAEGAPQDRGGRRPPPASTARARPAARPGEACPAAEEPPGGASRRRRGRGPCGTGTAGARRLRLPRADLARSARPAWSRSERDRAARTAAAAGRPCGSSPRCDPAPIQPPTEARRLRQHRRRPARRRRRASRAATRGSEASPSRLARHGRSSGLTGSSPASRRSSTAGDARDAGHRGSRSRARAAPRPPRAGRSGWLGSRRGARPGPSRGPSSVRNPTPAAEPSGGGGIERRSTSTPETARPAVDRLLDLGPGSRERTARRDARPRRSGRPRRPAPRRPGPRARDRRGPRRRRGRPRVRAPGSAGGASAEAMLPPLSPSLCHPPVRAARPCPGPPQAP